MTKVRCPGCDSEICDSCGKCTSCTYCGSLCTCNQQRPAGKPAGNTRSTGKPAGNTNTESEMNQTGTKDVIVASVVRGAKTAAADEAAGILLAIATALLGENAPAILSDPNRESLAKVLVASALHYAATKWPEAVPQADHVAVACGLVIEAESRDVIQPKLEALRPLFGRLAAAGATTEAPKTPKK